MLDLEPDRGYRLFALGRSQGHAVTGPLKYHIAPAKEHGVTREEMVEIITQLAFYAGWPKAWAAFPVAREVYGE